MIEIDSPHALGKLRQINLWRDLTLARLDGLRSGMLQTSRDTRATLEPIINDVYALLQVAVSGEWERRRADVIQEAGDSVVVPLGAPQPQPLAAQRLAPTPASVAAAAAAGAIPLRRIDVREEGVRDTAIAIRRRLRRS